MSSHRAHTLPRFATSLLVLSLACGPAETESTDTVIPATPAASASVEDTLVTRARPDLELAFANFDPATLKVAGTAVRLTGTCGSEGGAQRGIIPATIRLVGLEPHNPGVLSRIQVVSVAEFAPVGDEDVCNADTIQVTPKLDTLELNLAFFWNPAEGDDPAEWYTDATMSLPGSYRGSYAFFPAAELPERVMQLPTGTTIPKLRARIDSIRTIRR
jgi:hypothetical protein